MYLYYGIFLRGFHRKEQTCPLKNQYFIYFLLLPGQKTGSLE